MFMNKDRLHEIIIESIENLLNEKYSISDDVVAMTRHYCGVINKMLNLGNFQESIKRVIGYNVGDDRYVVSINCKVLSIDCDYKVSDAFNGLNKIILKIYEFPNRGDLQTYYEDCEIGGESIIGRGVISINAFSINGKINIPSIKVTLQHEIEHIMQHSLGQTNDKYINTANSNLNSPRKSCQHIIARLMYFFSDMEIDAKMHELYFDIRKKQISNPSFLRKCVAIKEKNAYLELLNELLNNYGDEDIEKVLLPYKLSKKNFLYYINQQIHRFEKKTWRVVMQYFDEIENVKMRKRIREE